MRLARHLHCVPADREAICIALRTRVGTSLLLKPFVDPDGGLADLVEWTKIAGQGRFRLVLKNDDSPIADCNRGIECPDCHGLELRQNDLRDHLRWKTIAAGFVQAGVDSAHLRNIVGWSMPL